MWEGGINKESLLFIGLSIFAQTFQLGFWNNFPFTQSELNNTYETSMFNVQFEVYEVYNLVPDTL